MSVAHLTKVGVQTKFLQKLIPPFGFTNHSRKLKDCITMGAKLLAKIRLEKSQSVQWLVRKKEQS